LKSEGPFLLKTDILASLRFEERKFWIPLAISAGSVTLAGISLVLTIWKIVHG
jgi:hypothetical protein